MLGSLCYGSLTYILNQYTVSFSKTSIQSPPLPEGHPDGKHPQVLLLRLQIIAIQTGFPSKLAEKAFRLKFL